MSTLYEDLGGEAAVDAAVELFYRKVMADESVERFFQGLDMPRQIAKQKAFLTMAFGGPNNYSGRSMRAAHRIPVVNGLNDTHFDKIVTLLGESLAELGVPNELISQVAEIAESVRNDVLNRETAQAN